MVVVEGDDVEVFDFGVGGIEIYDVDFVCCECFVGDVVVEVVWFLW